MSDLRLREFSERAQDRVLLPSLAEIERRGRHLRRRRAAVVGAVAAAVLAAGGWLGAGAVQEKEPAPAERPWSEVPLYLRGGGFGHPLDPGVHRVMVSADGSGPAVVFTTPPGWRRWVGPERPVRNGGYVNVLVLEVTEVVDEPCETVYSGKTEIPPGDAQALVDALVAMPRHRLQQQPAADDRFGFPATHLRMVTHGARCPYGSFHLWSTVQGHVDVPDARIRTDLWVVDVGDDVVLVVGSWSPGTEAWAIGEMRDIVDSMEIFETN